MAFVSNPTSLWSSVSDPTNSWLLASNLASSASCFPSVQVLKRLRRILWIRNRLYDICKFKVCMIPVARKTLKLRFQVFRFIQIYYFSFFFFLDIINKLSCVNKLTKWLNLNSQRSAFRSIISTILIFSVWEGY